MSISPPASASPLPAAAPPDAFPHTRRPLPWLLAGFLAMLFFVPIASSELKVHLPVDSRIDRFAVIVLVLAWLCCGGDQRAFLRTRRSKLFVTAACAFLVVAVASLLLDVGRIVNLGDLQLAEKRFALLGSFLIFAWFTLTALRFEDVRGFATYLIGLATIMSIGMLVERHTGYNVFYEWSPRDLRPDRQRRPLADGHPSGFRHRRPGGRRGPDRARARGHDDARGGDAVRAGSCPRRDHAQDVVAERRRLRTDARGRDWRPIARRRCSSRSRW